jgi:hypothetical protein
VSEESIRQHLRAALDQIVARESARLQEEGCAGARGAARVRAMAA